MLFHVYRSIVTIAVSVAVCEIFIAKEGKYAQFELPGNFTKLTYNDSISD